MFFHAALSDLQRKTTTTVFAGLIVMPLPRQHCPAAVIRRCSSSAVLTSGLCRVRT